MFGTVFRPHQAKGRTCSHMSPLSIAATTCSKSSSAYSVRVRTYIGARLAAFRLREPDVVHAVQAARPTRVVAAERD